jgi:hypothetical protein
MKKFLSAVLAFSLLGTAAASAAPWHGNGSDRFAQSRGWQDHGRDYGRDYRHDGRADIGSQIGLGLGLFALGAILASQSQPQPVYYSGYNNGYYGR